jgi:uncharacterized membrane protein YcaP (DUF421 family)
MDPVTPLDLQRLFLGEHPPLYLAEILLRVFLIYSFAVVDLRYMGKRGRDELSPFEYIVIIALGSATGDSMFYPEVPIAYAWLVISAMVLLDNVVAALQARYRGVNTFMQGLPRMVIREGKVLQDELDHEMLRIDELFSMLREREIHNTGEIRHAFLEPSGKLGIVRYEPNERLEGERTLPECVVIGSKVRTLTPEMTLR